MVVIGLFYNYILCIIYSVFYCFSLNLYSHWFGLLVCINKIKTLSLTSKVSVYHPLGSNNKVRLGLPIDYGERS